MNILLSTLGNDISENSHQMVNKCLSFSLLLDISSEWRIQSRIWNVYAPLRMFEALHNFLIFFTSTYSCIFINVCNIPQLECDHIKI